MQHSNTHTAAMTCFKCIECYTEMNGWEREKNITLEHELQKIFHVIYNMATAPEIQLRFHKDFPTISPYASYEV
jgi:hypothetical protein